MNIQTFYNYEFLLGFGIGFVILILGYFFYKKMKDEEFRECVFNILKIIGVVVLMVSFVYGVVLLALKEQTGNWLLIEKENNKVTRCWYLRDSRLRIDQDNTSVIFKDKFKNSLDLKGHFNVVRVRNNSWIYLKKQLIPDAIKCFE